MVNSKPRPIERDEEMMGKALTEARKAINEGKVGIGSLILWRNEILALTHNQYQETRDITAHGEMMALREAAQRLDALSSEEKQEVTLYTTLEPCLMCFAAISFSGIKRVVYSALNEDGQDDIRIIRGTTIEQMNQRLVRGPLILVPGVRRIEGQELLRHMGKLA